MVVLKVQLRAGRNGDASEIDSIVLALFQNILQHLK